MEKVLQTHTSSVGMDSLASSQLELFSTYSYVSQHTLTCRFRVSDVPETRALSRRLHVHEPTTLDIGARRPASSGRERARSVV